MKRIFLVLVFAVTAALITADIQAQDKKGDRVGGIRFVPDRLPTTVI